MQRLFIIFLLCFSFAFQTSAVGAATNEIHPKVKALGVVTTYGFVGGLLLGTAMLAFNARGRTPFVGASLGLYGGLIFGSYVILSHYKKEHTRTISPQYYPEGEGEYEGGFGGNEPSLSSPIQRRSKDFSVYVNFLKVQF